ncbi:MAG: hypothetical protein QM728_12665 [Gordonia sp. (in: high G+C Gram-positive bacteria)]|uniref:hypothetical protein n=1 Tax=Gordonia sp. (in: high G+C Gram-positive bacteria) TaxID=84139 RepID=UPI0039E393E2
MYAIYLGELGERPMKDELTWWASQETFERMIDEALAHHGLDESHADRKFEASMYKGLSGLNRWPELLEALDRVASSPSRCPNESDDDFEYYSGQAHEFRGIYQNYLRSRPA